MINHVNVFIPFNKYPRRVGQLIRLLVSPETQG